MNQEELQVAAFEIILHSGTARTEIHEAFADMREGRFDEAEAKLDHSNEDYHGACSRPFNDHNDSIGSGKRNASSS